MHVVMYILLFAYQKRKKKKKKPEGVTNNKLNATVCTTIFCESCEHVPPYKSNKLQFM